MTIWLNTFIIIFFIFSPTGGGAVSGAQSRIHSVQTMERSSGSRIKAECKHIHKYIIVLLSHKKVALAGQFHHGEPTMSVVRHVYSNIELVYINFYQRQSEQVKVCCVSFPFYQRRSPHVYGLIWVSVPFRCERHLEASWCYFWTNDNTLWLYNTYQVPRNWCQNFVHIIPTGASKTKVTWVNKVEPKVVI